MDTLVMALTGVATIMRFCLILSSVVILLWGLCIIIYKKDGTGAILVVPAISLLLFEIFIPIKIVNIIIAVLMCAAILFVAYDYRKH